MKHAKKVLALLLVCVTIFSFAACGKKGSRSKNNLKTAEGDFILKNDDSVLMQAPDKTLNPQEVYQNLTYTPKMFYGNYCIKNWFKDSTYDNEAMQNFASSVDRMQDPFSKEESMITSLPYKFNAGREALQSGLKYEEKYEWVELSFLNDKNLPVDRAFKYEVEGNKLLLTGVNYTFDNDTRALEYQLLDYVKLEYTFQRKGRELILTDSNGKSVSLFAGLTYPGTEDYLYSDRYITEGSDKLDKIILISYRWEKSDGSRLILILDIPRVGSSTTHIENAIATVAEDGLFTLTAPYEGGKKVYQLVYFLCGNDGLILTDGEHVYYFMSSIFEYNKNEVKSNVDISQKDTLEKMSEADAEKVAKKTNDLFADLEKAFADAGLKVFVNRETGEIAMDSTVLFGGDSAVLTDDGKAFLEKFTKVYSSIIYNEKYNGFIEKTMVEGHVAPLANSTYESGLPLSEERAKNVKEYCVTACADQPELVASLETIGYSNSKPILDENGAVDMAASRRVSFKFIINLENALQ